MTSERDERRMRRAVVAGGGPDDNRRRGGTYRDFAEAEFSGDRGRVASQSKATVIGAEPVSYPRLPEASPWHDNVVPPEEPLGIAIDALEPTGTYAEIQKSIETGEEVSSSSSPYEAGDVTPSTSSPALDGGAGAPLGHIPKRRASRRLTSRKA